MDFVRDQVFEYSWAALVLPKNMPTIVWSINDKVVSGNLFQYRNNSVLGYPELDFYETSQNAIEFSENGKRFMKSVRTGLLDWPIQQIRALEPKASMQYLMLLFDELKSYSKDFDISGIEPIGRKIYNVKFLENSSKENTLELPFLEVSDSDHLDPISLISKN